MFQPLLQGSCIHKTCFVYFIILLLLHFMSYYHFLFYFFLLLLGLNNRFEKCYVQKCPPFGTFCWLHSGMVFFLFFVGLLMWHKWRMGVSCLLCSCTTVTNHDELLLYIHTLMWRFVDATSWSISVVRGNFDLLISFIFFVLLWDWLCFLFKSVLTPI